MDAAPAAAALSAGLLARCTFPPPGTAVDCACSGGADSTALVLLAQAAGCHVTVWHVDHGLRPDAAAAVGTARRLAESLEVPLEVRTLALEDGPNLEARAREARTAVLPAGVLTGHTADDRAETVLINLLRGTGLDGLAAMGPSPRRPLLALRRAETVALCHAHGVRVDDDPMNAQDRFVRARVRHELLPLMSSIAGRDVTPLIVRTADLVTADLAELAEPALDATDARALAAAPLPQARRAVRRWLAGDGYPPDLATVERVLAVARGERRACETAGGHRVERHRQRLRIVRAGAVRSPLGMQHPEAD